MVELLVRRGADVTLAQSDGTTALMFAAGVKYSVTQQGDPAQPRQPRRCTLAIVTLLHEERRGSELELNARGETALFGAAFAARNKVIALPGGAWRPSRRSHQAGAHRCSTEPLNTGVADDGTGSRVGGKPGPETVALVRDLMVAAGLQPTAFNDTTVEGPPGPARETPKPASRLGRWSLVLSP